MERRLFLGLLSGAALPNPNAAQPVSEMRHDLSVRTTAGAQTPSFVSQAAAAAATIAAAVTYIRTEGYKTAGDGGGALYKKVEADPLSQRKFSSADGAWWEIIGSDFNVTQFGALGDGETDDRAAIQAAYDTVPVGGWLYFGKDKNYRINSKLTFNRSVNVDFGGSTVTLNNSLFPNNRHFDLLSTLGTQVNWTETIGAGVRTFTVTNNLAVGDDVLLRLGTDPYDFHEGHYIRVCKVTAASPTEFTVDVVTPYQINGTGHSFRPVIVAVCGITIKNLVIDYVALTTPDVHCWVGYVHDCIFDNIRAVKGRIIINFFNSYNLIARNVNAFVERKGTSSHGRLFTGWQIENVLIENVNGTSDDRGSWFFWENWCRGVKIINTVVHDSDNVTSQPIIHVSGGSYDVEFDGLTVYMGKANDIVNSGGTPSDYRIKRLRMLSRPTFVDLSRVESFADVVAGVSFMAPNGSVRNSVKGMIGPNASRSVSIGNGVLRRLWIYVESMADLTNVYLVDSGAVSVSVLSDLGAGQWKEIGAGSSYGILSGRNDPTNPGKSIHLDTGASFPANQKYSIVAEYWPISDDAATFQIGLGVAPLTVAAATGTLPTASGRVTIANAASPTVVELLEYCRELEARLNTQRS
ncbi:hypothetical protein [Mesorhizobium sp. M0204]|uniref:hypothetical protein n=1 Tax=unclassified Mesorhizobium TaxID=325217 RepID=UPI003339F9D4